MLGEKVLGPDHTSTLSTVNNLGLLYVAQGKLDEAEEMYQRALAGYEKALGSDHPDREMSGRLRHGISSRYCKSYTIELEEGYRQ
jgi:tetratricopeptide (TPR) repeat protein